MLMMNIKVLGRLIFGIIFLIIIIFLAGGASFLTRPFGVIFLALVLIWMTTIALCRETGVSSSHDKSQRPIYLMLGLIYFGVLVGAPWEYAHFSGPIPRDGLSAWAGLAIFAFGISVRQWALVALHGLYTDRLGIQPEHELVTSGPYRFVRHPGYLGEILSVLGIGLAMSSIIGLTMVVVLVLVIVMRMNAEEKMLAEHFGDEFQEYEKRTKRLVPFIY